MEPKEASCGLHTQGVNLLEGVDLPDYGIGFGGAAASVAGGSRLGRACFFAVSKLCLSVIS